MANEISVSVNLSCTNGNFRPPAWNESASFTQNAIDASGGVLNCSTTFADIPLSSVSTLGWCLLKNVDPTNSLDIGIDVGGVFTGVMTLKPTEFSVFRFKSGVVPAAKAQAGNPKLQYYIYQD